MKTYKVLMAETHAKYYEIKANNEDQARQRAYDWDEDQEWAVSTWDEGITHSDHAETEEV